MPHKNFNVEADSRDVRISHDVVLETALSQLGAALLYKHWPLLNRVHKPTTNAYMSSVFLVFYMDSLSAF